MKLTDALELLGDLIFWPTLALYGVRVVSRKQYNGIATVAWTIFAVRSFMMHYILATVLNTAFAAWHLYDWWNNGGGDGTKRRLRELGKKFQAARRTAPVTG